MNQKENLENLFKEKTLKEEFEQFLSSPEINPPQNLSEKILFRIHRDLSAQTSRFRFKLFLLFIFLTAIILSLGILL